MSILSNSSISSNASRYHTQVPRIESPNVPRFVLKWYSKDRLIAKYLSDLIQWAHREHRAMVRSARERHASGVLRFLEREYSPMRILMESREFQVIATQINETNYNILSFRERVFIRRAYELYGILSR